MAANYVLLEKVVVGAVNATSVTFSNIPQTGYTDLVVRMSTRTNRNYGEDQFIARLNLDTGNNYASRYIQIYDGSVSSTSISGTNTATFGITSSATTSANSFGNAELYIPNYTSSTYKPISTDSVSGGNASPVGMRLTASLWSNTAAVNSIFLDAANGTEWLPGSSFYLYGVPALGTTPVIAPQATGGDTIMTDGTYWYHAFLASGTFTPAKGLSCDVLVVAGGGSGGADSSGGGGAGGVIAFATQSLASGTGYTATIGAGGAGRTASNAAGNSGSNSQFSSLTAAVGGGAGGSGGSGGGSTGGSGGGNRLTGNAGTSGQGNAGAGGVNSGNYPGGGGGGAGAAGSAGVGSAGGAGGAGTNSVTNWGALSSMLTTTGLGVSGYIAGGGGGGSLVTVGAAGSGGASAGTTQSSASSNATANTGSGSGGGGGNPSGFSGNGGSGLVVVRYLV